MVFCLILPAVHFTMIGALLAQDVQVTGNGGELVRTESGATVTPQTRVLRIGARGHLIVRGSSGEQVTYRLTERVRARTDDAAHRMFGSTSVDSKVVSGVTRIDFTLNARPAVVTQLEIAVPRRIASVVLDVQPGDIEAYDLECNLRVETSAGQIRCDRIRGSFEGRTGGGEVHLGKIGGAIHCVNGAGSIIIDSAGGAADCQTAGGEIQIREAVGALVLSTEGGNIHVDRAGSNVEAHTAEGVIEVAQCSGMVFADTHGGSIQIGSARGARCQSGAGPVRVKTSSGPLQVQTALGSILAELFAGAHLEDSSLVAGSGDITVLIPSNVALSVLARNDSGANPRIVSDFSELRARSIAPSRPAAVRPMVYQGSINGGGPLLTLNTAGGIIYVKKSK
jgi:DUF4097 and DUF4098 domain-containing protein YvlB